MHNLQDPDPVLQLPRAARYQLVHELCRGLPKPLADTPEALLVRNHAALARVAAMAPVNSDEAYLAAQCVAAAAQAEDVMRLIRLNDGNLNEIARLNAQYASLQRTSLAARGHLLRVQTARYKREADSAAAGNDEWARHIAASELQQALAAGPPQDYPAGVPLPIAPAVAPPPPAALEPLSPGPEAVAPPLPEAPAAGSPLVPAAPPPPSTVPALAARAAAPTPAEAPPRRGTVPPWSKAGEQPRDIAIQADAYAAVYPRRAAAIRRNGGLPPKCDFGPPEPAVVRAIVTGTSTILRSLDEPVAA